MRADATRLAGTGDEATGDGVETIPLAAAGDRRAPSPGRIVLYTQPTFEKAVNGTRTHPAIVTRVWNEFSLNLHVFFDGKPSEPRTGVLAKDQVGEDGPHAYWEWPGRV
jgi:hypothetical protein